MLAIVVLVGCVALPNDALKLSPSSIEDRQMQSRVYEDVSEVEILSACVGIIQDPGSIVKLDNNR